MNTQNKRLTIVAEWVGSFQGTALTKCIRNFPVNINVQNHRNQIKSRKVAKKHHLQKLLKKLLTSIEYTL